MGKRVPGKIAEWAKMNKPNEQIGDDEWQRRFNDAIETLRMVSDIMVADRTCMQAHSIATAFVCEGERLMRLIYKEPDVRVAEFYYRAADAAALRVGAEKG